MDSISICNMALARLGEYRIQSFTDATAAARECSTHYPLARDEVLESGIWDFATARAELPKLVAVPDFGFSAQYELPNDCLRLLTMNGTEIDQYSEVYEIEGTKILTDASECKIRYIKREQNAALYSPLFSKALALKLAAELSVTLTGSRQEKAALIQEYELLIKPFALSVNANQSPGRRRDEVHGQSGIVKARSTGSNTGFFLFSSKLVNGGIG